jgi:hypothetical protein
MRSGSDDLQFNEDLKPRLLSAAEPRIARCLTCDQVWVEECEAEVAVGCPTCRPYGGDGKPMVLPEVGGHRGRALTAAHAMGGSAAVYELARSWGWK